MDASAPRLRARSDDGSCPLCRERIQGDDEPYRCGACDVSYHEDCAQELGGCSTLGCARRGEGPPRSEADEILAALRARPLVEPEDAAPVPAPRADLTVPSPTPEERARESRDRELVRAWARANGYDGEGERARWRGSFLTWTGLCVALFALLLVAGERKGAPLSTEEVLALLGVYLVLAVPLLISWRLTR